MDDYINESDAEMRNLVNRNRGIKNVKMMLRFSAQVVESCFCHISHHNCFVCPPPMNQSQPSRIFIV